MYLECFHGSFLNSHSMNFIWVQPFIHAKALFWQQNWAAFHAWAEPNLGNHLYSYNFSINYCCAELCYVPKFIWNVYSIFMHKASPLSGYMTVAFVYHNVTGMQCDMVFVVCVCVCVCVCVYVCVYVCVLLLLLTPRPLIQACSGSMHLVWPAFFSIHYH